MFIYSAYTHKHSYDLAERGKAGAGARLDDAKSGHEVQERDWARDCLRSLAVDLFVETAATRQVVAAETRAFRGPDISEVLQVVLAKDVKEGLHELNTVSEISRNTFS